MGQTNPGKDAGQRRWWTRGPKVNGLKFIKASIKGLKFIKALNKGLDFIKPLIEGLKFIEPLLKAFNSLKH